MLLDDVNLQLPQNQAKKTTAGGTG
uniref:U2266e n=1 Tax=Mycobacterium leprae TaxID=1769 RepID=Q50027_MYCLR|nr:u2266e [Mycobacterium leprae]